MKEIILNSKLNETLIVDESKLACNVGSGLVKVYATPMMIAAMEHAAATLLQQFLDEGETSVGIMINTSHDAATPLGMQVSIEAEIVEVKGKKVVFEIIAKDEKDIIGKASHARFIVIKDKFEAKAYTKASV